MVDLRAPRMADRTLHSKGRIVAMALALALPTAGVVRAADSAPEAGLLSEPSDVSAPSDASESSSSEPEDVVSATDASRAALLTEQGAAAFEAGEWGRAIELFEEAFALSGKPNLVFNIGRVHEELGHL